MKSHGHGACHGCLSQIPSPENAQIRVLRQAMEADRSKKITSKKRILEARQFVDQRLKEQEAARQQVFHFKLTLVQPNTCS